MKSKLSKLFDWCVAGVLIAVVASAIFRPYDSTDNASTHTRSGLYLYTDHATGCQYIKASWFATLTPRMVLVNGTHLQHVCGGYRELVEDGDFRE